MKTLSKSIFYVVIFTCFTVTLFAQNSEVNLDNLPEYIAVTARPNQGIGLSNVRINSKNSPNKDYLEKLEDYVRKNEGKRVRNLTDLLNIMSEQGYEYINGFSSGGGGYTNPTIGGNTASLSVNIIFKKKD